MLNLGVVATDSLLLVPVPTRAADGGAEAPTGTITQADFTITKVTAAATTKATLDASTIVWSGSTDSVAGKNRVSVDLSNDTDLQTAGAAYELWWESDATLDSQTVVECLARWTLETAGGKAMRLLREYAVETTVNDASATTTGFTSTLDVSTDRRVGTVTFTSGALAGESRLCDHTGTTVTILSDSGMPTSLKQWSAAPANSVTYIFVQF